MTDITDEQREAEAKRCAELAGHLMVICDGLPGGTIMNAALGVIVTCLCHIPDNEAHTAMADHFRFMAEKMDRGDFLMTAGAVH